jgi:hypothetical protein
MDACIACFIKTDAVPRRRSSGVSPAMIGYALLVREPRTDQEIHVRTRASSVR